MKKKKINLIDFKNFNPFKKIRKNMNISDDFKANFEGSKATLEALRWEEIKTKGLDISIDEIKVKADGTLEHEDYPGQKLIVYIRDFEGSYGTTPKFHIYWCRTLESMKNKGKHSRYVVSQRQDGMFILNKMNWGKVIEKSIEMELDVCKNCLGELNKKSKDYYTVDNFEIKKFLEEFNTDIKLVPEHTAQTQPLNKYPSDWGETSLKYRELKKWKCEKCGKDMYYDRKNLHVHHIDGSKQNINPSNLEVLCIDCHANEHPHMKNLRKAR